MLSVVRGEQRLHELGVERADVEQQRQQRKAELAAHAGHDAGPESLALVVHGLAHDQRHDQRLDQQQDHEQQQHERELDHEQPQVEQHADRDEEQPEQDVVERLDDRLGLMTELGLGEQHAGQEAAQRHRQTQCVRRPRARQHDEQHCQRERLGAALTGDLVEQRPQHPAADHEHEQQRDDGAPDHGEQPGAARRRIHA
jgi:hypothetical protein